MFPRFSRILSDVSVTFSPVVFPPTQPTALQLEWSALQLERHDVVHLFWSRACRPLRYCICYTMAGVARPESVQSWQEGDREQAKREGREIQIWKEHVPMESMSTYMAGAVLPSPCHCPAH